MSGKGHLFSQIFKPITTARRQVKMKRIASTNEGVKMVTSIDMRGRAEVLFFKTTKTTLISFSRVSSSFHVPVPSYHNLRLDG